MYKIFIEHSLKKFNTQWHTVYNRDLVEFIKEEILEICSNITNICMPRRVNENRLMGPPITELEFENDNLNPHVIIGGENIQLRMKKERPTLGKSCLQFGHPKKYCRSAEHLHQFLLQQCSIGL